MKQHKNKDIGSYYESVCAINTPAWDLQAPHKVHVKDIGPLYKDTAKPLTLKREWHASSQLEMFNRDIQAVFYQMTTYWMQFGFWTQS